MAQKLHTQYGFGYNNLKVLLGGWNTWREYNAKDANGYPIDTSPAPPTAVLPTSTAGK